MRCDRLLSTSMVYPGNYGYIPNTLAGDNDPLDVILISSFVLVPNSIIRVKVIGLLETEDEKGQDEKIIAVPDNKIDISSQNINSLNDLKPGTLNNIKHFFEHYKDNEPNKWVKVRSFKNKKDASNLVLKSMENFSSSLKEEEGKN